MAAWRRRRLAAGAVVLRRCQRVVERLRGRWGRSRRRRWGRAQPGAASRRPVRGRRRDGPRAPRRGGLLERVRSSQGLGRVVHGEAEFYEREASSERSGRRGKQVRLRVSAARAFWPSPSDPGDASATGPATAGRVNSYCRPALGSWESLARSPPRRVSLQAGFRWGPVCPPGWCLAF